MHSYLHTSSSFLKGYHGEQPMALALKTFFRSDKKYGSRDRKWISELCYARMRTFAMFNHLEPPEHILASFLLTQQEWHPVAGDIFNRSNWKVDEALITAGSAEKLHWMKSNLEIEVSGPAFPLTDQLSSLEEENGFLNALLQQPLVWLRCREGRMEEVTGILTSQGIGFELSHEVPAAIGVHQRVQLTETGIFENGLAEIQDLSSQQSLNGISPLAGEKWYDACAASGGKSLLLKSKAPDVLLTVSDVRTSILDNLRLRFQRNRIEHYDSFVADLSVSDIPERYIGYFDGIIADVPCSGSGTWGRTPEQMCFFTEEKLHYYSKLQQAILRRLVPALKPGGRLVYITCSVYRKENEEQVEFLSNELGLHCTQSGLIEGYTNRADTMYSAVFEKVKA